MTFPTAESVLEEQGRDRGRIEYLLEQEPLFRQAEPSSPKVILETTPGSASNHFHDLWVKQREDSSCK